MKLNFCTLFNSSYLSRGLAMYESLLKHCDDFHLYIYAFDDVCYNYLKNQDFKHLTVISLKEFENEELLRIKPNRSAGEYCWTCASSTIHHAITNFGLSHCTYIDADMLFYSNPRVLIDEMKDKSVLITSHRYTQGYDKSIEKHGKYCVQFMTFKNTPEGIAVLNWWKDACIDWCYARVENGKFGDQKYIDEFTTRFTGIHELEHLGGGVAPWNVEQYKFMKQGEKIIGNEIATGKNFELVFYHFHGLKFYNDNIVGLSEFIYCLEIQIQNLIYFPYIKNLLAISKHIASSDEGINPNGNAGNSVYKPRSNMFTIFKLYIAEIAKSKKNILCISIFKRLKNYHYLDINKIVQQNKLDF